MRYITIPDDVELGKDEKGESVFLSFFRWFDGTVLNDPKWGKTAAGVLAVVKLTGRFEEAEAGDRVPVEDKEFDQLKAVVEEPSGAYITQLARKFYPFILAVLEAEEEKAE